MYGMYNTHCARMGAGACKETSANTGEKRMGEDANRVCKYEANMWVCVAGAPARVQEQAWL